ncbi:MAG: MBL fold metallo-hydrolase [Candidatus Omnitrophota bacterium]|nr:MBL fold metallo-hydrolase [Candidatus Omnitrophota bacterium]MBU2527964.1 fibronectin type III domain-containing protein [bacterium]MBU3930141.1 fibronectin type III domain-containing protein [bacterium]MBU4123027.1 fibronectin type III domain-containing protein [bacterium]
MRNPFFKRAVLSCLFFLLSGQSLIAGNHIRVFYVLWGNGAYGDSIFIQLPGADKALDTADDKNVLIDGGGQSLAASSHLDNFLDYLGVTTINHMVLTHPHDDHYAGLNLVLNNYTVDNFYCTGTIEQNTVQTALNSQASCTVYKMSDYSVGSYLSGPATNVGTAWDPNVVCKVLAFNNAASDNDRSLVLKMSLGESSFLFGGDATVSVESVISSSEGPIDFYKMHHHGSSATSNDTTFLSWLAPSYSMLPTGGRSAPPPDATAISRVIDIESIIYRTDLDGTILVKADEKGNFDITRMTAFGGDKASHNPASFPGDSYGTFDLSAGMPYVLAPPALPSGLSVLARGRHEVTLDWTYDLSGSIEGYYVFYSTYQGGDPGANIAGGAWKNAGMSAETGIYQRYNSTPITNHPYSLTGLASDMPYYFRLSALTTYYYERRYSNEASTTTLPPWRPLTITTLSGMALNGEGDINLSWLAPSVSTENPTGACSRYRVIYASYSFSAFDSPYTFEITYAAPEAFGIDFSTAQPKNPGQNESFCIKNIPDGKKYFAVFGENEYGEKSDISNISSFTVTDSLPPAFISDTSVLRTGSDGIYLTWTMPGDNGTEGAVSSCQIIYAENSYFSPASTIAISGTGLTSGSKNRTLSLLSEYTRYWIKVQAADEAGNISSSTIVSCYTGTGFINTPSFSDSVSVSTSPSLDVTFKIEIDTVTAGSPSNCVELWDTRDNLGVSALTKLATNQYQVTASSDSRGFSVSPGLDFNHRYRLVVSSSLKDIDGKEMISATVYYFVTVCSPSEDNIFIGTDGSSVTVAAGQFSSPASVSFISTLPANLNPSQSAAYDSLAATYTVTGAAVRGFTVAPGTVTAVIPVSGGIPYVYNSDTLSFEKAVSYILNGEVVFEAESPAVWLFVTRDSFTVKKSAGVYAYPVPATGNKITFTNLGSSAEISVFTISGKCVLRENVTPDPVNGEWVWNFSQVSPGLYLWAVDGTSKGMLMIKR